MALDHRDILEYFTNDLQEWQDIYDEGDTDVRVISGDVWEALDEAGAKQRRDANRPMLSLDEIGQFQNQVINNVKANPRGIKFSPTGLGANDRGALFYQNKMREIEYRSHAHAAYALAFQNCIERSFGYVRVLTKEIQDAIFDEPDRPASERDPDVSMFDQELWIEGIENPSMVLPDPYARRADLCDMKRAFVLQWRNVADFKRDFPGATVTNFTPSVIGANKQWFSLEGESKPKQVLTAEYWCIDTLKTRKLLLLKPKGPSQIPLAVWADDLKDKPRSEDILRERKVPIQEVRQCVVNGCEILSETQWPGRYIPITGCFGKILFVDEGSGAQKKIMSMTRLARDPFMLYCYYRTCEAELVGMTPKFPYFVYKGQLSPKMLDLLQRSLHEPVAVIEVEPMIESLPGTVLPPPTRNPYEPPLQALELGAEAARRAIQAAMGISPLPTPAQRNNEKTGAALQRIEDAGQVGSFHFVDSFDSMVRQVGVISEDLIDKVYDTHRLTGVYPEDERAQQININDPDDPESIFTKGSYQVTIAVQPAKDSEREEANAFVDGLTDNIAEIAQVAGPQAAKAILGKSIRLKNLGPIANAMADDIDPPPQQNQAVSPQVQQLQQQVQQMQAALGQAQQALQSEAAKEQMRGRNQLMVESLKQDKQALLQITLKKMDLAGRIEVARITAARQAADTEAEAREEATALGLEHAQAASESTASRAHELGMAHLTHQQTLAQIEREHQQAMAQAQQAHEHALLQGAQQQDFAASQPDQSNGNANAPTP